MAHMGAVAKIVGGFRMTDDAWKRHANPWSVWTRFAAIALAIVAIWSRVWLGWWCLVPVALVLAWGLITLAVWPTVFGASLIALGQLWRIDRVGLLSDETRRNPGSQSTTPVWRSTPGLAGCGDRELTVTQNRVCNVRLVRLCFVALVVVAALVASCASHSGTRLAAAPPAATSVIPAQLQFSAKTVDGKDFSGQSLFGKPAVLWFWAPWCPVCRGEAPSVGQIAATHPAVTFVGVAGLDQLPAMQQFVTQYPVGGFTHLADTDGAVWAKFGVTHQPAYAFISPDGRIDVVKGPLSAPDLTARVTALSQP
jgi:thiol-disulfide isomerase/thioredoxin